MKNIYIYIFIIVSIFETNNLFSQQDLMTNNKFDNLSIINPAFRPLHQRQSLVFHHRSQWTGFEGAPTTDMIVFNSKVFLDNIAMGGALINDNIGPTNNFEIRYNFNYSIKITKTSNVVFGSSLGINVMSNHLNNITIGTPNDVAFAYDATKAIMPNLGIGVYYYSYQFYAGLSIPKFIQSKKGINHTGKGFTHLQRHYYLIAGSKLRINNRDKYLFEPKFLLKVTKGAPIQYDLNLDFLISYSYIIGLAYRSGDIIGINLGVDIANDLTLLYSFGYSFSNTSFQYNGGSHEIMLRYLFPNFRRVNKTKKRHRLGKGNRA